ncbi:unnamed protein product [Porites evermanni]|uniref:OTU domain-containing protein n=1 Tax=Porites evermanni TaxID=104178 RepID=A0ABN8SQI1_9CNID|nr:unnamed protein product [Porites evermanni]
MPTPEPSVILHNLDQFLTKWKGLAHDDKQLITQKGQKALKNIKSHILKGCLSNIPVGCCTSVQKRMHREMKKILSSNRIGTELAYSKFSRFFFQHNARKSEGGLWSPIMEEAKVRRLDATGRSLEAKEAYVETFGIREKSVAQTTEGKDSSPKAISLKELTCDQISEILDEIKFSIEEQSDLDDHREHENDHTDASTSPRDNSVGQILRILQYGLSLFKVMLYFQKMQGVQAVSFLKLPFMSRALIHARSLLETSEKNSDISARVSSFGYNVEPVPGDGNCFFHAVSFQLLKLMSGENGRSTQERLLNLGISPNQSMASIAAVLRQRIVDEWQGPFVDEYQQFFHDSELDVYTEAEHFRQSGEFSRPLGDAMPLAMANILQMPIVLITSAQNMPIVTITPRRITDEVSVVLAYTQRGVGHYDAVTQNNIAKVGGDSPDNDSAKMIKESCKEKKSMDPSVAVKGCRCGSNTSKRTNVGGRVYKSRTRCSCLSGGRKCTEHCRCQGKCGGDVCYGGNGKISTGNQRKGRKRKQHVLQEHRRNPSSSKFAKLKGEVVKDGPFNQLEYSLLCAIILITEQMADQDLSSIKAFKIFNDLVHMADEFQFNLPISLKSQDEITKELKKVARIRKVPF